MFDQFRMAQGIRLIESRESLRGLGSLMKNQGQSRRFQIITKRGLLRLLALIIVLAVALTALYLTMIRMPGKSFRGELPPLTESQGVLEAELRRDVDMLGGIIGQRNLSYPKGLQAAVDFLERSFINAGYQPQRQTFEVFGSECCNIEVELTGATKADEIIIVGAHYDSEGDNPAANDNGSGVAATLAIARRMAGKPQSRTVRFVLFVNEEPPYFQTDDMGSVVYAKRCRARNENIVGMISLETIGYYSDEPDSQSYPIAPIGWLYPKQGNFIGFVGNHDSRALVRDAIGSFRTHAKFPSEGAALPGWITGVGWSDHWAFWQQGYPALMVTDTALFRYPHYHKVTDTPDKLNYQGMARVVDGMHQVVLNLANQ
jgi:hypothetical protein